MDDLDIVSPASETCAQLASLICFPETSKIDEIDTTFWACGTLAEVASPICLIIEQDRRN